MTYAEIIKSQMLSLPTSIKWWPKYFYHFTDIQNALGIIDKGWIYGRQEALANNFMKTDNASPSVISVSQNSITEYARLYFRPRTPTQYHNEGYKPQHIRSTEVNANCPVPVFFFLDSETVLKMDGVKFSATSCAGLHDLNLLSGVEEFEQLPFDKIYHNSYLSSDERNDIVKHRHAEVVRLNGLPIKNAIKGIVCRSVAEKQTLLYLLNAQIPKAYQTYHQIIRYAPELDLFFNNGIFIKTVEYCEGKIEITFNDSSKRYGRNNSNGKDIQFNAEIHYLDDTDNVINRVLFSTVLDYAENKPVLLDLENQDSNVAIVEIKFDDHLMYANKLNMSTEDLL